MIPISVRAPSDRIAVELLSTVATDIAVNTVLAEWNEICQFIDAVITASATDANLVSVFNNTPYQALHDVMKRIKTDVQDLPATHALAMVRFQIAFHLIKSLGGQHVNISEGFQPTSKAYLPPIIQRMIDDLASALDVSNKVRNIEHATIIIDTFIESKLTLHQYMETLVKAAVDIHDFTISNDGNGYFENRTRFECALKSKSVAAMPQVSNES